MMFISILDEMHRVDNIKKCFVSVFGTEYASEMGITEKGYL